MLLSPELGKSSRRVSLESAKTLKVGKVAKENKKLRKQLKNLQDLMTTDKILGKMKNELTKCSD
jgi:hypothetical protein